jgi:hypothetical protein
MVVYEMNFWFILDLKTLIYFKEKIFTIFKNKESRVFRFSHGTNESIGLP